MKEFRDSFDEFKNLSNEEISNKFYDALESLFNIIRKNTGLVDDKKTENDKDISEKESDGISDRNTCSTTGCNSTTGCKDCTKHRCHIDPLAFPTDNLSETDDLEDKDKSEEDVKNEYFTRIGNILTDWLKPWLNTEDKDLGDKDSDDKDLDSKTFDYEIDEVLEYDTYKSVCNADELNEKVFDIFDMCVFKMLVIGHNKTCCLRIKWNLENDSTFTFTFYWDPETASFYGYVNDFNPDDSHCLKYNEQTRGFDKIYRSTLSDYMKDLIPEREYKCEKEEQEVKTADAKTVPVQTEPSDKTEVEDVEQLKTCDKDEDRKNTAANIYQRYNNRAKKIDHNSGEIWDRLIQATDDLIDWREYMPETTHGETTSIRIYPNGILTANPDLHLPKNLFENLDYTDFVKTLGLRYGFPRVVKLESDVAAGVTVPFIRCYLK